MKKSAFLFFSLCLVLWLQQPVYCQTGNITLTFSAVNNNQPVIPDSVYIKNIDHNCDTMLYPPNLSLTLDTMVTNIVDNQRVNSGFRITQNFPNPFSEKTQFTVEVPENDLTEITLFNGLGVSLLKQQYFLKKGKTSFTFTPGIDHVYLITASRKNEKQSIKMIHHGLGNQWISLEESGFQNHDYYKSAESGKGMYFEYEPGNQLIFVAHTGPEESGITDIPGISRNYEFQFAHNIPCPGIDSVFYEGQYYHTIQIYSQCWMKESLNAGTIINAPAPQSNNGIIEKYCYGNNPANCLLYGGMYYWEEVMAYSDQSGAQGICPQGWHIPTDEEWKILEGIADSFYPVAHNIWNTTNFRGLDVGYNLKATSGWPVDQNGTDLFGFKGLPTGYWWDGGFSDISEGGAYWTSDLNPAILPYYRALHVTAPSVARNTFPGIFAFGVRCLKNE